MSIRRLVRVNELLKREIATELFRVMNEGGFDMAAVTVTRVEASPNLRHARVFVSVRAEPSARGRILALIKRHRTAIQADIGRRTLLKYTPHLEFQLDESIEQGDHVLAIIADIERRENIAPPEGNPEEQSEDTARPDDAG